MASRSSAYPGWHWSTAMQSCWSTEIFRLFVDLWAARKPLRRRDPRWPKGGRRPPTQGSVALGTEPVGRARPRSRTLRAAVRLASRVPDRRLRAPWKQAVGEGEGRQDRSPRGGSGSGRPPADANSCSPGTDEEREDRLRPDACRWRGLRREHHSPNVARRAVPRMPARVLGPASERVKPLRRPSSWPAGKKPPESHPDDELEAKGLLARDAAPARAPARRWGRADVPVAHGAGGAVVARLALVDA